LINLEIESGAVGRWSDFGYPRAVLDLGEISWDVKPD
jgi:hypothetical protein